MGRQLALQAVAVVAVCAWSALVTLVLVLVVKRTTGLRIGDEAIDEGLDLASHGEQAYRSVS